MVSEVSHSCEVLEEALDSQEGFPEEGSFHWSLGNEQALLQLAKEQLIQGVEKAQGLGDGFA